MSSKDQNTPNEQVSEEIQMEQQQNDNAETAEAEAAVVDPRDERIAQLEEQLAGLQNGVRDAQRWWPSQKQKADFPAPWPEATALLHQGRCGVQSIGVSPC